MKRHSCGLALILVAAMLLQACAGKALGPSVFGRSVIVVPREKAPKIQGELLAVDENRVIVSASDGVHEVAVPQISEVRVQRHSLDGKKGWKWTLIGAAVTSGGMMVACSTTRNGFGHCAIVSGVVGVVPWLLFGGASAQALGRSAYVSFDAAQRDRLRPFARFPQGLPPEFDLRGNIKPPAEKR